MEAANNGDAEAQLDDDGHDGITLRKAAHQDTSDSWWPDHIPHETDCEGLAATARPPSCQECQFESLDLGQAK